MPEWLLQFWVSFRSQQGFPGLDRVSGPVSRRGSLCRYMVLRLQAVAWSRYYIFMSRQCLLLFCDYLAIKVFVLRPIRPRQVVPFVLQHVWSWKINYVATKRFCVATDFGQGQEFLCRNRVFMCRDRVFLCCDRA